MPQIKDVLFRNIEEIVNPVIYFHQLEPEQAAREVGEYVFTSRDTARGPGGIHEQMVKILSGIHTAVQEGHKLPASWISGFFGSGKSSFAKLLGLALDKLVLPGGKPMGEALLERDDTPGAQQLREAFAALGRSVDSMAVIFDIGTASSNDEKISHTIYREFLKKMGYSKHDGVAHFELGLEAEGRYQDFLDAYQEKHGIAWREKKDGHLAPQQFRAVYKTLYPDQDDLLEVSTFNLGKLNISTLVENLCTVIDRRAPGKTIFIVIDEVSQYIARDQGKMLDLQSFVAQIGGKARPGKSPLWLLVTGQEQLEAQSKDSLLFKLKDRFPDYLKVHLDRTNVTEVVNRRLLRKKPGTALEALFTDAHLDALKLHGYEAAAVTREAVLAHYPLLPAHIPLFMDITQSIRNSSVRTQSDAGGVRSVLNNIWDLFNQQPVSLKDRELGTLLTLDMLYDIIGSSIDSDVQLTLSRIFEKHPADSCEARVAKTVALLELLADNDAVTPERIAALLYPRFGSPSVLPEVKAALEVLQTENWIQLQDKSGWSIQNNAAQDWNRQKRDITVKPGRIEEILIETLKELVAEVGQPTYLGARFPLECSWGSETVFYGKTDPTRVRLCFHWTGNKDRRTDKDGWIRTSREQPAMFHWVSGETGMLEAQVREKERSVVMQNRHQAQGQLSPMLQQLLKREVAEEERLLKEIKGSLRKVWLDGVCYFEGTTVPLTGSTFDEALRAGVESKLGQLFHKFKQGHLSIPDSSFQQLLTKETGGLDLVFLDNERGLGIAQNDAGKIVFRSTGPVPDEVFRLIEERGFCTGERLLQDFGKPPYGYSPLVVKASVVGLLRAGRIRINATITSIQDPGCRAVFEQHKEFCRAQFETLGDIVVSEEDRIAIRRTFEKVFRMENVEAEPDALADLVFRHFPQWKDRLSALERKLDGLGFPAPVELAELSRAFTACLENRQVEGTLERVKHSLETFRDGIGRVLTLEETLSPNTESELRALQHALEYEAAQLVEVDEMDPVAEAVASLRAHLGSTNPWNGYADLKAAAEAIRTHYRSVRLRLKERQQTILKECEDQFRLRPDFAALEQERQLDFLQLVRKVYVDVDEAAVSPSLLVLRQQPARLQEATARAHQALDQYVNESSGQDRKQQAVRIHTVRLNLQNRVIRTPEELEHLLADLKSRCLVELDAGASVRFEE